MWQSIRETSFFDEIEENWDKIPHISRKSAHWTEISALGFIFGTRNRLSNARENPFPGGHGLSLPVYPETFFLQTTTSSSLKGNVNLWFTDFFFWFYVWIISNIWISSTVIVADRFFYFLGFYPIIEAILLMRAITMSPKESEGRFSAFNRNFICTFFFFFLIYRCIRRPFLLAVFQHFSCQYLLYQYFWLFLRVR